MSSGGTAVDVAVVTGAAGGIGAAVITALVDQGVRVAGLDVVEATDATLSVTCDVTDQGSVTSTLRRVEAELGAVSSLICAAGVVSEAPLAELQTDEWRRVVEVSLTGTFLVARAVVPSMVAHQRGSIVAFSSAYATKGYERGGHYAAAKAGVEALVKSLALELAGDGVRVNAIAPGPVRTPMLDHIPDLEEWSTRVAGEIPMGRIGEPEDLVGPVLFFLSDQSRYVTGQVLHVNGGRLMP